MPALARSDRSMPTALATPMKGAEREVDARRCDAPPIKGPQRLMLELYERRALCTEEERVALDKKYTRLIWESLQSGIKDVPPITKEEVRQTVERVSEARLEKWRQESMKQFTPEEIEADRAYMQRMHKVISDIANGPG